MGLLERLATDDLEIELWVTSACSWAVYRGDRDLIERVASVEHGYWERDRWLRPLSGTLVDVGHLTPERLGNSLLQTARRWQAAGVSADPRYVWEQPFGATWLVPYHGRATAELVWQSVSWSDRGVIYAEPLTQSMQQHYRVGPAPGMSFQEQLGWHAARRTPPRGSWAPALWLVAWTVAIVLFALSATTPLPVRIETVQSTTPARTTPSAQNTTPSAPAPSATMP
jgi:hypothetical protein